MASPPPLIAALAAPPLSGSQFPLTGERTKLLPLLLPFLCSSARARSADESPQWHPHRGRSSHIDRHYTGTVVGTATLRFVETIAYSAIAIYTITFTATSAPQAAAPAALESSLPAAIVQQFGSPTTGTCDDSVPEEVA